MDNNAGFVSIVIGTACLATFALGVGLGNTLDVKYNLFIPKDGTIKEALDKGVPQTQLEAAFQEAAPDITKREIKKLTELCEANRSLLSTYGLRCEKVFQAPSGSK